MHLQPCDITVKLISSLSTMHAFKPDYTGFFTWFSAVLLLGMLSTSIIHINIRCGAHWERGSRGCKAVRRNKDIHRQSQTKEKGKGWIKIKTSKPDILHNWKGLSWVTSQRRKSTWVGQSCDIRFVPKRYSLVFLQVWNLDSVEFENREAITGDRHQSSQCSRGAGFITGDCADTRYNGIPSCFYHGRWKNLSSKLMC